MKNFDSTQKFLELKCCVLIPTFNNEETLHSVISNVLKFTSNIVVVNDGSTDRTSEILANFSEITLISFSKNQGKGVALKEGFKKAEDLGFEYAISIDSDGQHFAEDLPHFLKRLEKNKTNEPELLLIGSREMNGPSVPKKSSFGNRFSNFWFWVETGIKLTDTQCGFRLYPLKIVNKIPLFSTRFELEIEVIVKAAWKGVLVENIPVKVWYEAENRVSHFRPFQDFSRISILNTYLVFVALLYIHPRNKVREFKKKGLKRFWNEDILKNHETPFKKSKAVALGVFFGISPLWGLQTLLTLLFAQIFRLNKLIAFAFSNVSLPPFIPLVVYLSYQMGALILGKKPVWTLNFGEINSAMDVIRGMGQYILGSFALAALLAFLFGVLFYFLFSIFKNKRPIG